MRLVSPVTPLDQMDARHAQLVDTWTVVFVTFAMLATTRLEPAACHVCSSHLQI